jgi:flavodoxin
METAETGTGNAEAPRSLVVVCSYHHHNTEKVARAIAGALGAEVTTPRETTPDEIAAYDLVGFGSGIYSGTFHPAVLDLAGRLPPADGK